MPIGIPEGRISNKRLSVYLLWQLWHHLSETRLQQKPYPQETYEELRSRGLKQVDVKIHLIENLQTPPNLGVHCLKPACNKHFQGYSPWVRPLIINFPNRVSLSNFESKIPKPPGCYDRILRDSHSFISSSIRSCPKEVVDKSPLILCVGLRNHQQEATYHAVEIKTWFTNHHQCSTSQRKLCKTPNK